MFFETDEGYFREFKGQDIFSSDSWGKSAPGKFFETLFWLATFKVSLSLNQCALLLPKSGPLLFAELIDLLFSRIATLFSRSALLFPGITLLFSRSDPLFSRMAVYFLKMFFCFPQLPFSFSELPSNYLLWTSFSKNAFFAADSTFSSSSELLREIIFAMLFFSSWKSLLSNL